MSPALHKTRVDSSSDSLLLLIYVFFMASAVFWSICVAELCLSYLIFYYHYALAAKTHQYRFGYTVFKTSACVDVYLVFNYINYTADFYIFQYLSYPDLIPIRCHVCNSYEVMILALESFDGVLFGRVFAYVFISTSTLYGFKHDIDIMFRYDIMTLAFRP